MREKGSLSNTVIGSSRGEKRWDPGDGLSVTGLTALLLSSYVQPRRQRDWRPALELELEPELDPTLRRRRSGKHETLRLRDQLGPTQDGCREEEMVDGGGSKVSRRTAFGSAVA